MVKNLLTAFAVLLGSPPPRKAPVWLARLIAGSHAVAFTTRATPASNARFGNDLGWSPQFPTYRERLNQVVAAWRAEGFAGVRKIKVAA